MFSTSRLSVTILPLLFVRWLLIYLMTFQGWPFCHAAYDQKVSYDIILDICTDLILSQNDSSHWPTRMASEYGNWRIWTTTPTGVSIIPLFRGRLPPCLAIRVSFGFSGASTAIEMGSLSQLCSATAWCARRRYCWPSEVVRGDPEATRGKIARVIFDHCEGVGAREIHTGSWSFSLLICRRAHQACSV